MIITGYILIAIGSIVLGINGFGIDTWQWWVIFSSLIIGEFLVCNGKDM
jgi:hypothetical protein